MSKKPLRSKNYSTEKHVEHEKKILTNDQQFKMRQHQPQTNTLSAYRKETKDAKNENSKNLTLKLEEASMKNSHGFKYNTEPSTTSSLENTSNKSLLNEEQLQFKNPNHTTPMNSHINDSCQSFNGLDHFSEKPFVTVSEDFGTKIKKSQQMKTNKTKSVENSYFKCYVLHQYFIYLLLSAIIISSSFGFYYLIVTTGLRIEELEERINEKISARLAVQFYSHKDYFAKKHQEDEHRETTLRNNGNFLNLNVARTSNLKFMHPESESSTGVRDSQEDISKLPSLHFLFLTNENEKNKSADTVLSEKFYILKKMGNFNFVIFPTHTKNSNFQLNNFCKMTNDQCVELFNKNKADKICDQNNTKIDTSRFQILNANQPNMTSFFPTFKSRVIEENENSDESSPNTIQVEFTSKALDNITKIQLPTISSTKTVLLKKLTKGKAIKFTGTLAIPSTTTTTITTTTIQTTTTLLSPSSTTLSMTTTTQVATTATELVPDTTTDFNAVEIKTSSPFNAVLPRFDQQNLNEFKIGKSRPRKRIESTNSSSRNVTRINQNLTFNTHIGCNFKHINSKPTYVVFMGVFHCAWMNDIGSHSTNYYITKGYKGSSLTMCLDMDELKSYRCYRHLPLQYSYYGTGHAIYKGYMFYNQDGTNNIIVHNLESQSVEIVKAPDEAACCNLNDNMYNVKHSGYFDFETDENGLWLIYKQSRNIDPDESDYSSDYSDNMPIESNLATENRDVYVVAKIDEENLASMRIERKWIVRVGKENVANMFIICGQLYALKNTGVNPAQMYKVCDLINDASCTNNYDSENKDLFNLTISSRQITSLKYDPDKKMLYMVDGGSFVYYKTETY